MKIVKVEVEVHSPDEMSDAAVSEGIDEMLDAGEHAAWTKSLNVLAITSLIPKSPRTALG